MSFLMNSFITLPVADQDRDLDESELAVAQPREERDACY